MNRLLLFTYFGAVLFSATCFRIGFDGGNPKDVLKQRPVLRTSDQRSLLRQRRQGSRGGFNWDSNQNVFRNPSRSTPGNIFFDDSDFNSLGLNLPQNIRATPTPPIRIPGMQTTRSPCEDNCPATTQFDPVCGDNNVTYTNINWLRCAQQCGRNINLRYVGSCPRVA